MRRQGAGSMPGASGTIGPFMSLDLPRSFKLITVWLLLGAAVFVGVQWWQHRA